MSLQKTIDTTVIPGTPSSPGQAAYTVCTVPVIPPPPAPFPGVGTGNGGPPPPNPGNSGGNTRNCTWVVIPPDPNCPSPGSCNGTVELVCG